MSTFYSPLSLPLTMRQFSVLGIRVGDHTWACTQYIWQIQLMHVVVWGVVGDFWSEVWAVNDLVPRCGIIRDDFKHMEWYTFSQLSQFVIAAASSCSMDWCCWFNQRQWIDAWAAKLLSWLLKLSFVNYVQSSLRLCNYRSGSLMFQNLRNIIGNCCGLLKWGVFDSPSCSIKSFFQIAFTACDNRNADCFDNIHCMYSENYLEYAWRIVLMLSRNGNFPPESCCAV